MSTYEACESGVEVKGATVNVKKESDSCRIDGGEECVYRVSW